MELNPVNLICAGPSMATRALELNVNSTTPESNLKLPATRDSPICGCLEPAHCGFNPPLMTQRELFGDGFKNTPKFSHKLQTATPMASVQASETTNLGNRLNDSHRARTRCCQ